MGSAADIVAYVERSVLRAGVLQPGEALLLAVSGGQDSVAMLLALLELRERLDLRLTVGHVNHGLRGVESDGDEAFVRELAEGLGLPVRAERVEVKPGSAVEEGAREARFAALRSMAKASAASRIALAHTATDRAETLLMNLLRGCGLEGLAAMPAGSGDLVRPLLGVTREETAAYCAARGVQARHDRTNADESLLRNRVRLRLLPWLAQEYQPNVRGALLRLAEIAEAELGWTRPLVREALEGLVAGRADGLTLELAGLRRLAPGLRSRVLREAVAEVRGDLQSVTLEHLQTLDALARDARTGARAELPGLWAERTSDALRLRAGRPGEVTGFQASLSIPGETQAPGSGLKIAARLLPVAECDPGARGPLTAHLDAAVTGPKLIVRSPRAGDRLAPLGMSGTRKLHDLLVDKKIPRAEREGMVVVATTEGEIVWVVGLRISERAKVTATTQQVAELVAQPVA